MSTKKYTDWRSWWDGLRSCMIRAGATAIVTQLTAMGGTNAVASMNIPGLEDIALKWKTALAALVIQFCFHVFTSAAKYIQDNQPQVVIISTDTVTISKTLTTETAATAAQPETKP